MFRARNEILTNIILVFEARVDPGYSPDKESLYSEWSRGQDIKTESL